MPKIQFLFDYTTGELKVNPQAKEADKERAQITIDLYGLDHKARRRYRRKELWKWLRGSNTTLEDWAYRDFLELNRDS